MRLIDADKLKVYLQEYLGYGHAVPWVDAQPTAYDVEEVVEEVQNVRLPLASQKARIIGIIRKGVVE